MDASPNFLKARGLREQNKLHETIAVLKEILGESGQSFEVLALAGDLTWEMGDPEKAAKLFRAALELNPESEEVSRGLFHCLGEMDKTEDAFSEMKRFTEFRESPEYARLVREILRE